MEFKNLKIGSLFSLSKESKLIFEKTSSKDGDSVGEIKFGVILPDDQKVHVRKKRN